MRIIYILLVFIIFSSCTTKKIIKINENDRIKKVEQFFKSISKRRKKIKSIQIEAKADTFNKGKRIRGKLMMSVTRPDMLRIDTLSPFDQPISTMLVSYGMLYFYNFEHKKMYYGNSSIKNLSLFLPIRISLKQFIDMFSGISPMIAYKKYKFIYIEDTAEYELILFNGELMQKIKYIASDLQISSIEFYKNNKKTMIIKFSKIRSKNSIKYAKKIYFEDFNSNSKLKLIITDIEYNGEVDDSIYKPIDWKYGKEELE